MRKRYSNLKIMLTLNLKLNAKQVCKEIGCSVDMPCFGTFNLCRGALKKVIIQAITQAVEGEAENE